MEKEKRERRLPFRYRHPDFPLYMSIVANIVALLALIVTIICSP